MLVMDDRWFAGRGRGRKIRNLLNVNEISKTMCHLIATKIIVIGAAIEPMRPTIAHALNIVDRHTVGH